MVLMGLLPMAALSVLLLLPIASERLQGQSQSGLAANTSRFVHAVRADGHIMEGSLYQAELAANESHLVDAVEVAGQEVEACATKPLCDPGRLSAEQLSKCKSGFSRVTLRCENFLQKVRAAFSIPDPLELMSEFANSAMEGEEGTGKSGANFLKTTNGRFVLKTMTKDDMTAFKGAADLYTKHMESNAATTMLVRIFAMIKFSANGQRWMLMENFLPIDFDTIYDLKGSTEGRKSKNGAKVRKDLNWIEDGVHPELTWEQLQSLVDNVKSDTEMLAQAYLIDYSLLYAHRKFHLKRCEYDQCIAPACDSSGGGSAMDSLCVEAYAEESQDPKWTDVYDYFCTWERRQHTGHHCFATANVNSEELLEVDFHCFGIIDILKYYTVGAATERFFKAGAYRDVSVQPPKKYRERFTKFILESFDAIGLPQNRPIVEFKPSPNACRIPWQR